jgi:hypothetical protein
MTCTLSMQTPTTIRGSKLKAHKLIRKWDATDAAVEESQKLEDVLDLSNTGKGMWADSA